ncbi:UNVERIFIED_CONTAM: uroporphyrin-III C-methyltransferase [Siphonaria sp. JEL0065]|nr:uroporphyrin-III C-methyltransferase [Siphonaria sp. JEL0065]
MQNVNESLVLEFKTLRTRNLLVRVESLPLNGNDAWLAALDCFAASGCCVNISVAPKHKLQVLAALPLEYQLSTTVQDQAVLESPLFDFAIGVGLDSESVAGFAESCRAVRVPVHVPGHSILSDFSILPIRCESTSDVVVEAEGMEVEDELDSLDSSSYTALNPSPPPSPILSPMQVTTTAIVTTATSSDFDLDPYFVFPPKNAGFSCTSFIPPPAMTTDSPSSLTIAGAGPGTPCLLTVASISAIQSCTLLIVDRLVPQELVKYALTVQIIPFNTAPLTPKTLSMRQMPYILHTRKVLGNAPLAQQEIEDWTAAAMKLGHCVVRLKGGDPFVYGRGGEELLSAKKVVVKSGDGELENCKVKVIPGLSSSLVAPLMAGIPPTHRGVADQVLIATGRLEEEDKEVEWPMYAENRTTVVLMAMGRIRRVVTGMTESAGYPLDVPVAIVEKAGWGSEHGERVWKGVLSEAVDAVKELGLKAHATLIVGRVVHAWI